MKIDLKQPILDKNDRLADVNRALFAEHHVFVVDLLASPGSGKTSTILATIEALRDEFNIAVIEGDIASNVDAAKISAQGIPAVQINTGGACHLESDMIRRAVDVLDLDAIGPKGTPGEVPQWAAYIAGVAWALERDGLGPLPGFDAALVSCVPLGAGLSSSAALECATSVALDEVAGLALAGPADAPADAGRARLVTSCVRAENEMAGAPTGGMDQSASLRCHAGHALELDCRDGEVTHVPFDLAAEGLALLVIDTRAKHSLADGQYGARRSACERAAKILGVELLADIEADGLEEALAALRERGGEEAEVLVARPRHVVTEIARTVELVSLLSDGAPLAGQKLARVGELMDASHESLRVDYEVTCPELDVACQAARDAGAHGARMTGGGFGGSAIALVDAGTVQDVARAVVTAYARRDLGVPAFLDAVPSAPAGRAEA